MKTTCQYCGEEIVRTNARKRGNTCFRCRMKRMKQTSTTWYAKGAAKRSKKHFKTPIQKLREKVWDHCKRITRKRYRRSDGLWECYTCSKLIENPRDCHTGHCIPASVGGMFLKYDLRNLRIQCVLCNVHRGGMGAEFVRRLQKEEGDGYVQHLFEDKRVNIKELGYSEMSWLSMLDVEYQRM